MRAVELLLDVKADPYSRLSRETMLDVGARHDGSGAR